MPPFFSKKPPKSSPKSIPRCIKFLIDFCIDFSRFLIDFGCQLGAMLAAFSAQQGGANEVPPLWLLRCFFLRIFFELLAPGADGVPHFWPPSPMGYPIFGRFLNPIWCQLGAILGHFGARAGSGWAGGLREAQRIAHLHHPKNMCSLVIDSRVVSLVIDSRISAPPFVKNRS